MWIKYVTQTEFNKMWDIVCVENDEIAQGIIDKGFALRVAGPDGQDFKEEIQKIEPENIEVKEEKSPKVTEIKRSKKRTKK